MEKSEFEELVISTRQAVLFKHERAVVDAAMALHSNPLLVITVARITNVTTSVSLDEIRQALKDVDGFDEACRAYEEVEHG